MSAEPCAVTDDARRKRLHDLRAPLITMRAFSDELAAAVARLAELVEAHERELPADYRVATRELLDRDVGPCLGYLRSSVDKLAGALESLSPGPDRHTGE